MGAPTNRILAVLELLQAHGQLSGTEIARRLGVDRRTVRRYIVALEEMGIPVTAERGAGGGYSLVAGFKLPPMLFTEEEALALSVGLLAAGALGLAGTTSGIAAARAKLERVMPTALRHRLQAADETMHLDLRPSGPGPESGVLATLSAGAQALNTVRVAYEATNTSRTVRDFDPYGLAFRGGCWYVAGHCHLRQGTRTFRVDRITSATRTTRSFERPAKFDTLGVISTALATLPRAHSTKVLLHTDMATAKKQVFATLGIFEDTPEGVLLHSQTDDLEWLARELARLPFRLAVRSPPALAAAVVAHAQQLLGAVASG